MKRIWIVLLLSILLVGCRRNSVEISVSRVATPVMQDIYDDEQSTVYIKTDRFLKDDVAIADIMTKKKEWEKRFPSKKLVAMSIITGSDPSIIGLLIHYEQR